MENNNSVFSDDGDPEIQELVEEFGLDLFVERHTTPAGEKVVVMIVACPFGEVDPFALLAAPGNEAAVLRAAFTCDECCNICNDCADDAAKQEDDNAGFGL